MPEPDAALDSRWAKCMAGSGPLETINLQNLLRYCTNSTATSDSLSEQERIARILSHRDHRVKLDRCILRTAGLMACFPSPCGEIGRRAALKIAFSLKI
jgi:hypothetical protein